MTEIFFDGVNKGDSKDLEEIACDNATFQKKQLDILRDEGIMYENDLVDNHLEKHNLSFDDFLATFSPLIRRVYCTFGCPSREYCGSRAEIGDWNHYEAFSKDYVLANFPTNPCEGSPVDTVDDLIVNAIELYLSSREEFVKRQEDHLKVTPKSDFKEELLEVQHKALEHYEHIFRKIVYSIVIDNGEGYNPELGHHTLNAALGR